MDEQHRRGVLVRIIDMPWLDYSAPIDRFIAQTFAALAELEREQTRERQRGGIDAVASRCRTLAIPTSVQFAAAHHQSFHAQDCATVWGVIV
jgi:DNA invertase Pin-like site-specific DNA recombinase